MTLEFDKDLIVIGKVANIFGVTGATIKEWERKGRLTSIRNPLNKFRFYKMSEVQDLYFKMYGRLHREDKR